MNNEFPNSTTLDPDDGPQLFGVDGHGVQGEPDVDATCARAIDDIWAIVRFNRDSLDSERYCKMIREMVHRATAEIREERDTLAERFKKLRKANAAMQKHIKAEKSAELKRKGK